MNKANFLVKICILGVLIASFSLGWFSHSLTADIGGINLENPLSDGLFKAKEHNSPADHIKKDQIHVYEDEIILDIKNAVWAEFTNTNSMDPLFDETANSIEIKPEKFTQIHKGDIIAYKPTDFNGLIIHRVTEINFDQKGWYCKVKGDNLSTEDPEKIRFEQVHSILVAIIY